MEVPEIKHTKFIKSYFFKDTIFVLSSHKHSINSAFFSKIKIVVKTEVASIKIEKEHTNFSKSFPIPLQKMFAT